jgi:hypothetical protein
MKLGVDLEMFSMGGQAGGNYPAGLHSEMAGEGWQRNHFDEEDGDEDEDFMFQGPNTASREQYEDGRDEVPAFEATFADFSKRQDFTATGFNLDTGAAAVEPFADFAAFSDAPATAPVEGAADGFADFAAFADFEDTSAGASTEPAASSEPVTDDFAPSEF